MDHRQAEPGAAPGLLGREEGLDRARERRRHPCRCRCRSPTGGHRGRAAAGLASRRRSRPRRRDRQRAAVGHRVAGIDAQVEDRELELVGIGAAPAAVGIAGGSETRSSGRPSWRSDRACRRAARRCRPRAVCSSCRRAKPSRRWTRILARSPPAARWRSAAPIARRSSPYLRWSMSSAPMIGVSRLLKSCATPPVSWPSVSSFCASCSCASAALMLGGALLDALLELGLAELVGSSSSLRARLILAAAAAQRRSGEADQGGRVERPLEEGDVAEQLEIARRRPDCARARRRAG